MYWFLWARAQLVTIEKLSVVLVISSLLSSHALHARHILTEGVNQNVRTTLTGLSEHEKIALQLASPTPFIKKKHFPENPLKECKLHYSGTPEKGKHSYNASETLLDALGFPTVKNKENPFAHLKKALKHPNRILAQFLLEDPAYRRTAREFKSFLRLLDEIPDELNSYEPVNPSFATDFSDDYFNMAREAVHSEFANKFIPEHRRGFLFDYEGLQGYENHLGELVEEVINGNNISAKKQEFIHHIEQLRKRYPDKVYGFFTNTGNSEEIGKKVDRLVELIAVIYGKKRDKFDRSERERFVKEKEMIQTDLGRYAVQEYKHFTRNEIERDMESLIDIHLNPFTKHEGERKTALLKDLRRNRYSEPHVERFLEYLDKRYPPKFLKKWKTLWQKAKDARLSKYNRAFLRSVPKKIHVARKVMDLVGGNSPYVLVALMKKGRIYGIVPVQVSHIGKKPSSGIIFTESKYSANRVTSLVRRHLFGDNPPEDFEATITPYLHCKEALQE